MDKNEERFLIRFVINLASKMIVEFDNFTDDEIDDIHDLMTIADRLEREIEREEEDTK